ncbi:TetR/AcrR family transcriptional regulator [Kitasatospora sp. NPDC088391]|uniref:TetR/AcrR family transcriptional regulator n=1 Tax=Kitasatospora sp. NPDC088391 TaxID=3364074 RepID=UPI0037F753C1
MTARRDSAKRRTELVEAAERALLRSGLSALTVRAVAGEAGVSPGSVLYHYANTDDLVYELHRTLVDRYVAARLRAVSRIAGPAERLARAFRSGLPAGPDDASCRLLYELHGLAARSRVHAALMSSLWDREVLLYETILEAGAASGAFTLRREPHDLAQALLAMEDGLGLHLVSHNSAVPVEHALRLLTAFAADQLSCDLPDPAAGP